MSSCEMCGHAGDLHKAIVEGTLLLLCDKCVRFGEVVELKKPSADVVSSRLEYYRTHRFSSMSLPSTEEAVARDYAVQIKSAREKLGKTQEEVAQALAERVSVLQKIESGNMEPSLKLARKLEQFFKIQIVRKIEKDADGDVSSYKATGGDVTIGDVIKFKE